MSARMDVLAEFPDVPVFHEGPDKEKYRHYVERILRWGEIAAGLRGNVTLQSLRSDLRNHCSDDDISMYASPSRQSSGTIIRNRPMEHVST